MVAVLNRILFNAVFGAVLAPALGAACGGPARTVSSPSSAQTPRSYYLTAPGEDASPELARVFESVHQIEASADYLTYHFTHEAGVTEGDIHAGAFEARADTSYSETLAKAGTATIIARSGNRLTLLTVNHVVQFPSLRLEYHEEPGRRATDPESRRLIASASRRTAERGRVVQRSGSLPFDVIARDEQNDLALIRLDLDGLGDFRDYTVLDLAPGDARRLSWGSFIYVLGFPRGYPMVTRAIVSSPDHDRRGAFLSDAIWNEGMSGGLVLAIRATTGRLELVGLARASAAAREFRLRPDTTGISPGSPATLYDGPLWLETGLRTQYGISLPIPMTAIGEFLRRQGVRLRGGDR